MDAGTDRPRPGHLDKRARVRAAWHLDGDDDDDEKVPVEVVWDPAAAKVGAAEPNQFSLVSSPSV